MSTEAPVAQGRAWQAARNAGFALLEFAWPLGLALLVTPLLIRGLGVDAYGVLSVVAVLLGMLGLLDLGIGGAGVREMAQHLGRGELRPAATVFGTVVTAYVAIGLAAALFVFLAAPLVVTGVLLVPDDLVDPAVAAFRVSGLGFPMALAVGALASVLRAAQRFDLSARVALVFSTIGPLAALAMVQLGAGIVGVAASAVAVNAVAGIAYYRSARRLLGDVPIPMGVDTAVLRRLIGFASWFLVASIGVVVLYQLDKLLVAGMLGVTAVTYYVVPGNIANRIQGLLGAATAIVFPASSDLHARGDREALSRLYRDGTRLTFLLAASMAVPMAVFAEPFLRHWVGADFARESSLAMVLLVGTYALLGLTGVVWGLAFGAGRAKVNALFVLGMASLDVVLFVLLVRPYGISGAAAAYLLSALVGVPLLMGYLERTVLGLRGVDYLAEYARVVPAAVIVGVLALWFRPVASSFTTTLLAMGALAVALPLVYFLSGLAMPTDRALARRLIDRVRPR